MKRAFPLEYMVTVSLIFVITVTAIAAWKRGNEIDSVVERGETCARLFDYASSKSDTLLITLARNDCKER